MAKTRFKKGIFRYGSSKGIIVDGPATFRFGAQSSAVARTATVDGLTTGVIAPGTRVVLVTVTDANHIITLPAAAVGTELLLLNGATGYEIRTPAGSNVQINTVDSDGTNELAITANLLVRLVCVSATNWVADAWTAAGVDVAALVPDAA
jgi:hypothetical protein